MNTKEINQLLDRYFEGLTSLEEEARLKDFFRKEDIPEELEPYQDIFRGWNAAGEIHLPTFVENEILAAIEADSATRVYQLQPKRWWRYAAAVLVLAIALSWWMLPANEPEVTAGIDWSKYEPETPEEAVKVYQQAMLKLTSALNEGANSAAKHVKRVETVGQFFE